MTLEEKVKVLKENDIYQCEICLYYDDCPEGSEYFDVAFPFVCQEYNLEHWIDVDLLEKKLEEIKREVQE